MALQVAGCGGESQAAAEVQVRVAVIAVELTDPVPRVVFGRESGPLGERARIDPAELDAPLSSLEAWAGLATARERQAPPALRFFPRSPVFDPPPLCERFFLRGQVIEVTSRSAAVAWGEDLGRTLPLGSPGRIDLVRLGPARRIESTALAVWAALDADAPSPGPPQRADSWAELALRTLERAALEPPAPERTLDPRTSPWARTYGPEAAPVRVAGELLVLLRAPGPAGLARLQAVAPRLVARDRSLEPLLRAARIRAGDLDALEEAELRAASPPDPGPVRYRPRQWAGIGPLPLTSCGRAPEQLLDLDRLGAERVFWTAVRGEAEPELARRVAPWAARVEPVLGPSAFAIALGAHLLGLAALALGRMAERFASRRAAARAWLIAGTAVCLLDARLAGVDLVPDPLGVLALVIAGRRLRAEGLAPGWTPAALLFAFAAGLAVELAGLGPPWSGLLGLPLLLGALGLLRGLERIHAAHRPVVAVWCRGAIAVGTLAGAAALLPSTWLVLPVPDPRVPLEVHAVESARIARLVLPLILPACLLALASIPPRYRIEPRKQGADGRT